MKHTTTLEMYIGTYTDKGIYHCALDLKAGCLTEPVLAAAEIEPIFLVLNAAGSRLYSTAIRNGEGQVAAFTREGSQLHELNHQPSGGGAPCHLSLHPEETFLAVANYVHGTATIYPVLSDGSLDPAASVVRHEGSGPNLDRQQHPHPHSANFSPDGRYLYIADLGIDRIMVYPVNQQTGVLGNPAEIVSRPGSGPRHLTFHPQLNTVYVIHELDSTLTVYEVDSNSGAWQERQTLSTLPADFTNANTGAEVRIHPNGKFLYASNRGHDSLAIFSIGPSGDLTFIEHVIDGIDEPRHFNFDPSGTFCVVGNQDADTLISFRVDTKTGRLHPTGHSASVEKPVCIQFIVSRVTP